jgi:pyruvate kinase
LKLTLLCDCGNTETIGVNLTRMNEYVEEEESIYLDDFEQHFSSEQYHPDEIHITCKNCGKEIKIST